MISKSEKGIKCPLNILKFLIKIIKLTNNQRFTK